MALLFLICFMMPYAMGGYNSYPKITQMEKKLYSQSFENQDIYNRLNRIEMSLYKSVQSHKSLSERVDTISNQMHISSMPGYLIKEIDYLENACFQKLFQNESPDNRLERLEYHLAGAIQDGNYKDRVFKLKTLSNRSSIDNYFNQEGTIAPTQYQQGYYTTQEEPPAWQKTLMMLAPIIMGIL